MMKEMLLNIKIHGNLNGLLKANLDWTFNNGKRFKYVSH